MAEVRAAATCLSPLVRVSRTCRWLLCALFLITFSGVSVAERIPLQSGKDIEHEVVSTDEDGVVIVTARGSMKIPWHQISPLYPRHPLYRRRTLETDYSDMRASDERPPELQGTGGAAARETRGQSERKRDKPVGTDPFIWVLVLVFVVFWLHVFCVWSVSRDDLLSGGPAQAWNLAALTLGLPVALLFAIKYGGLLRLLNLRKAPAQAKAMEGECQLYTWDSVPLSTAGNRKLSTGLAYAQDILSRAARADASDVHLDTTPDGVNLAFRVDGTLRSSELLDPDEGRKAMAAIRMAAGMDLAKVHEAQDGACHMSVGEDYYDLRIARAYAVNGETLVIRLLRAGGIGTSLADLGIATEIGSILQTLTRETAGIVIMAGPTGSGKTSTIYAMLRMVVGTGRTILTIEDPVEYRMDGATQISISARSGQTFADALKASMRHDPDVIFVGEIRDPAAMDVAFHAALTGHLVFTTIHATSVLATYGRLHELGLSHYMINTGLKAIICQRLVRKLCPGCRQPYVPEVDEFSFWGLSQTEMEGKCFYRPVGCPLCESTGFRGRTGVFRVLTMNNKVRKMVQPDVPVGELQETVDECALGHVSGYAKSLLLTGTTTPDDLQKTLDMFDFGKHLGTVNAGGRDRIPLVQRKAKGESNAGGDADG